MFRSPFDSYTICEILYQLESWKEKQNNITVGKRNKTILLLERETKHYYKYAETYPQQKHSL